MISDNIFMIVKTLLDWINVFFVIYLIGYSSFLFVIYLHYMASFTACQFSPP